MVSNLITPSSSHYNTLHKYCSISCCARELWYPFHYVGCVLTTNTSIQENYIQITKLLSLVVYLIIFKVKLRSRYTWCWLLYVIGALLICCRFFIEGFYWTGFFLRLRYKSVQAVKIRGHSPHHQLSLGKWVSPFVSGLPHFSLPAPTPLVSYYLLWMLGGGLYTQVKSPVQGLHSRPIILQRPGNQAAAPSLKNPNSCSYTH